MDRFDDLSDAQLVTAVARYNEVALAEVYRRHGGAVYGLAKRVLANAAEAEDVTQDVFLRLWNQPDRFDPSRGSRRSFLLPPAPGRAGAAGRASRAGGAGAALFAPPPPGGGARGGRGAGPRAGPRGPGRPTDGAGRLRRGPRDVGPRGRRPSGARPGGPARR